MTPRPGIRTIRWKTPGQIVIHGERELGLDPRLHQPRQRNQVAILDDQHENPQPRTPASPGRVLTRQGSVFRICAEINP